MKVLIVDDDPVAVAIIQELVITQESCRVFPFRSSAKALTWCKRNDPDLVLVDYHMPAPNGLEFIDLFRGMKGKEEIPLIMLTGDEEREIRYQALEKGANDFLSKPFDVWEFKARIKNMLALRSKQKELSARAVRLDGEIRRVTANILRQERETIMLLSRATELRDPETSAHLQRMSYYSRHIATHLGFNLQEQELIFNAAPLHDIGKVGIPDDILHKSGVLDDEEFTTIMRHTVLGHEILRESTSPILQMGAEIALTHHEKFNGTGYPQRLAGDGIPLSGRIAAVADVFDALTSQRPYKESWTPQAAKEEIKSLAGSHFDPCCVEAFFKEWDDVLAIRDSYHEASCRTFDHAKANSPTQTA
jgi:putative two-component system response regulator